MIDQAPGEGRANKWETGLQWGCTSLHFLYPVAAQPGDSLRCLSRGNIYNWQALVYGGKHKSFNLTYRQDAIKKKDAIRKAITISQLGSRTG